METDKFLDNLRTPESYEQYAQNVEARNPAAAAAARAKRLRLLAAEHEADSAVVTEGLQAVYAYEGAMSRDRRRKVRASRTWQK